MTRTSQLCRPLATAGVLLALAASLLLPPTQARAATPQLRVAVDNGRTDAKVGAMSVYTLTVTNLGRAKVKNLRVSQTIPAGATFVSAGSDGRRANDVVTWTVDLPAAGTKTVTTKLKIDKKTPATLLRVATVACVRSTKDGPPLVCAADSDQLPAGAAAARAARATASGAAAQTGWLARSPWVYAGAGAASLLVAGAVVLVVRRRRSLSAPGRPWTPK